jgi:hypothetical protein
MFTDSSQLVYLVPFATGLLVMMARFDLYLSKRRNQLANARYLAEMQSVRNDYLPLDRRPRYSPAPRLLPVRAPLLLTS